MARLLLVRHGQSAWNAESRWQGWADPPLSDLGATQAAALASALAPLELEGVVSSDLQRARRTATIVAGALRLAVQTDPALRERDVGAWSGHTTTEIERHWPQQLAAWRAGRLAGPPDGETDDTMAVRVIEALLRLLARAEDPLLVVTHGGLIRLVERRLGLEPSSTPNLSGRWIHGSATGGFNTVVAGSAFLPRLEPAGWDLPLVHDGTKSR
ncbi:MAG: histidine phosphatase family protein [Actinomycetota bacterium]|nr:histidine phosphatase family protein [Actinomycetota bacterium]